MATLKFYLKNANKQNLCSVLMCYQNKGKKFRFFTKVQVLEDKWVNHYLRPQSLEDYDSKEKLDACKSLISEIEKEALQNKVYFSVDEVEQKFRERISLHPLYQIRIEKEVPLTNTVEQSEFFRVYDYFIAQTKSVKTKGTIYHFECSKKILQNFEKFSKTAISFECINNRFYENFKKYLIEELNYLNNSVGGQIKNLKAFLNYCSRNDLTEVKLNVKDFKTIREDVDIIALSEIELFQLYNCDDLTQPQRIARDYLCFECFTGLRFSDIGRLKHENIKDDFIVLRTQKTRDNLYIPINVFAKEILERYKGMYDDSPLPPSYTNQKTNQYIKEAAKKAEIDDLTMVEKFSGSKRITLTQPKYKLICTHTGRRTFITLSFEKGMQTEMIMKITGIKKWETLKKYLKVSEKSKLNKMNEFWNRQTMKAAI
jgi:integrase